MLRIALPLLLLCACGGGQEVGAAGTGEAGLPPALEALFEAAERDPAALVELVEAASAHHAELDPEAAHLLAERLEPYCARLFFGPVRAPGMERVGLELVEVQSGELPGRIARRHGFDHPLFGRWNEGYDPRRVLAGQELKLLDLSGGVLTLAVDRQRHLSLPIMPNGGVRAVPAAQAARR